MTIRTRYFVIASLLVLTVGLGTALVAYSVGFPMSALTGTGGPDDLQYVPRDAAVVAYADVHEVMTSELRQKMHEAVPNTENGQREFENQTGINIETDIDHVVAFVTAGAGDTASQGVQSYAPPSGGLVLARGRFDEVKIEAVMREHGARIEDYKGKRLIVVDVSDAVRREVEKRRALGEDVPQPPLPETGPKAASAFAVAFIERGLCAVGNVSQLKAAIDLRENGQNVTTNDDLMNLVRSLDSNNAWAVGRFDALQKQAKLPLSVTNQLPPITWFSISGHVNGGIRGVIRAETRDDEAANNLRDVVRGFLALAKMQAGSKAEYQTTLQALELGGTGKTVALSFAIPAEILDLIGKSNKPAQKPGH